MHIPILSSYPQNQTPTHPLEIQSVAPEGGAPWEGAQGVAFLGEAWGVAAPQILVVLGGAAPSRGARGAPASGAFLREDGVWGVGKQLWELQFQLSVENVGAKGFVLPKKGFGEKGNAAFWLGGFWMSVCGKRNGIGSVCSPGTVRNPQLWRFLDKLTEQSKAKGLSCSS